MGRITLRLTTLNLGRGAGCPGWILSSSRYNAQKNLTNPTAAKSSTLHAVENSKYLIAFVWRKSFGTDMVDLPEGNHRLQLRHFPRSLPLGLIPSLFSLL